MKVTEDRKYNTEIKRCIGIRKYGFQNEGIFVWRAYISDAIQYFYLLTVLCTF